MYIIEIQVFFKNIRQLLYRIRLTLIKNAKYSCHVQKIAWYVKNSLQEWSILYPISLLLGCIKPQHS